jgi:uncharacterized protein with HEPN domain
LNSRDLLYLGHMLDLATLAMAKIEGLDQSDFDADENLRLALAHLVQTIGEAARRVDPSTQETHSSLPWSAIIGMRNKLVHDYMGVDFDVVWEVVSADLPDLVRELRRIVPPSQS